MASNPPLERSVIDWLLDSDPAIRWQVMQDLLGAPAEEVAAERAKVASEGWGRTCLPCREQMEHGAVSSGITAGIRRCTC